MSFVVGDDIGVRYVFPNDGGYVQLFSIRVWVSGIGVSLDGAVVGRRVSFIGMNNEHLYVIVSDYDISCGRVFKILEYAGVEISCSRKVRELIRVYLSECVNEINFNMALCGGWHRRGDVAWYGSSYLGMDESNRIISIPSCCYSSSIEHYFEGLVRDGFPKRVLYGGSLFAVGASLASSVMEEFGFKGVVLNFYTEYKGSVVYPVRHAVGVWSNKDFVGFKFPVLSHDAVELKRGYKNGVLYVDIESHENDSKFFSFLKRYFNGRKGVDEGVSGMIVSTGRRPICDCFDIHSGCSYCLIDEGVLILNIKYDFCVDDSFHFLGSGKGFVGCVNANNSFHMDKISRLHGEFCRCFRVGRGRNVNNKIRSFFALVVSVLVCAVDMRLFSYLYNKNNVVNIIFDYFKKLMEVDISYWNSLYNLSGRVCKAVSISTVKDRERLVLMKGDLMMECTSDNNVDYDCFIDWLVRRGVVIPDAKGRAISVCHVPGGKTSRGYRLSVKSLNRLMAQFPNNALALASWGEGAEKYREIFKNHPITK